MRIEEGQLLGEILEALVIEKFPCINVIQDHSPRKLRKHQTKYIPECDTQAYSFKL